MVMLINGKELSLLKGKRNNMIAILYDEENNTYEMYKLHSPKVYRAVDNVKIDLAFSLGGLPVKNWLVRVIGNKSNRVVVKVSNYKRNFLVTFNHLDMLKRVYNDNFKIPSYIKAILNRITDKLIDSKRFGDADKVTFISKPLAVDAVLTFVVPCVKTKGYVSIDRCRFCKRCVRILDTKPPKVICSLR